MEYITDILIGGLDAYILYKFMHIFFEERNVKRYVEITAYFLKFCICGAAEWSNNPLMSFAAAVVCCLFVMFCYSSPMSKRIFAIFFISAGRILAEAVGAVIVGSTGLNLLNKMVFMTPVVELIVEVVYWLTAFLTEMFQNRREELQVPKRFMITGIFVQLFSIIAAHAIYEKSTEGAYGGDILLFLLIVSNFIIIYLYDSMLRILAEKVQIKNMQHQIYYNHQSELLRSNQRNLQQFRHDIRNRLYALEEMLKQGKYQEAANYLEQIAGKLERVKMYSETGNIAVDGIINYKLTEAETNRIEVYCHVVLPESINIQEDDMIVVLGNLLDNAVEAAKNMESERKLALHMEYDRGCIFLSVKNTYCHSIKEKEGRLVTSKADKELHGIGLQSVDSVINRYGGMKKVSYDDSEFSVDVVLPLKSWKL